jgi:FkbH-like protein
VEQLRPNVTVLQLSHRMTLAPLLDGFALANAAQRDERTRAACAQVERAVSLALAAVDGKGLLLVQGIASPQTSPLGLREHRDAQGLQAALFDLNRTAQRCVSRSPNALFVDEEQLLSSVGKRWLLDDLVSTYSHHGALAFDAEDPSAQDRLHSFGVKDRLLLHRVLARAYVDHHRAWKAEDTIRCIAVDLDNTLWPGEAGQDAWSLQDDKIALALMYGRHGGLHEALKILKGRGILLAVVSKNTAEVVLRKWHVEDVPLVYRAEATDTTHYLVPADFVRLKINWEKKSDNLRALLQELGITQRQLAFIDDHPVERAEVQQALPGVMVLGEDMNLVREQLLTHPRFQVLTSSDEARQRTESTRARLERDDALAAAPDHAAFLSGLQVRCTVTREVDAARIPRITELLNRTNQFNTTALRLTAAEVETLLKRPDAAVLSMTVVDRFADYGLVGVAVVVGQNIRGFALSCRVLGLEAERVLLHHAVHAATSPGNPVTLSFTSAPEGRNLPATRLFQAAPFKPGPGEDRVLDVGKSGLPQLPAHCVVTLA